MTIPESSGWSNPQVRRYQTHTSLDELNAEVLRLVDALNARPFSRREGCRDGAFFGEERAALNPLPAIPSE